MLSGSHYSGVAMALNSKSIDYTIFGLTVRSEIALPDVSPASGWECPAVIIRLGAVDNPSLTIEGVGRYRIKDGREIIVDPAEGAHERNVRLYLLGSAMGMLLHQRGLLPLHANAIEIEGRAVAFMGPSGAGKSTIASWFHDHGHQIVADDVCVIGFDHCGRAFAQPGLPRLRLWRDALERTGRLTAQFDYAYADATDWEKYDVPLADGRVATTASELAAVYLLETAEELSITGLSGAAAADACFANTYRGEEVRRSGSPQSHWRACMRLLQAVPLFRLRRPLRPEKLDEQCAAALAHCLSVTTADSPSHQIA